MQTKTCNKCRECKSISEFNKKDSGKFGVRSECKKCQSENSSKRYLLNRERELARVKQYTIENKEKVSLQQKRHRESNKDKIKEYLSDYRIKNRDYLLKQKQEWYRKNKERHSLFSKEYREKNAEAIKAYHKKRYIKNRHDHIAKTVEYKRKLRKKKDPDFTASEIARSMLRRVLDLAKANKKGKSFELLGYTGKELRDHIESQFIEGMEWINHGEWHVDHIIPVSFFVKNGVFEPKIINALKNLRPLWKKDNLERRFDQSDMFNCIKHECIDNLRELEPLAFERAGL